jgi:hypothetical protein
VTYGRHAEVQNVSPYNNPIANDARYGFGISGSNTKVSKIFEERKLQMTHLKVYIVQNLNYLHIKTECVKDSVALLDASV